MIEDTSLEEAAMVSLEDNVTLFAWTDHRGDGELSLADQRVRSMLLALQKSFELAIVDLPKLSPEVDALVSDDADCPVHAMLLVSDQRLDQQERILTEAQRLKSHGVPAVGIAQNYYHESE